MKLTVLGSGSAMPTPERYHSAQLLEMRNKQFLIDCGEGTQNRMIQFGVRANRLNHIFISHLHGDHCFGLMGLISALGMLGRTADIEIHAQPDLEVLLRPQIDYFCGEFPFQVKFHPFSPYQSAVIYEDRSVTVTTIPLKHRAPSVGFLFEEKAMERHLVRSMVESYDIPLRLLKGIKNGDKVKISSARGSIDSYALVTDRVRPFKVDGKPVEMVGMIWHFGPGCAESGDSCNTLTPSVGDPNSSIPEYKAFLVNIQKA